MLEDEKRKIINFVQDFGCCTLKQLQILYNKPNDKKFWIVYYIVCKFKIINLYTI